MIRFARHAIALLAFFLLAFGCGQPEQHPRGSVFSGPSGGGATAQGAANTVQTTNGSGALQAATNVLATSGVLSIGPNPASAGVFRLPSAQALKIRNNANSADKTFASTDTSDNLFVGNVFPSDTTSYAQIFICPSGTGYLRNGDTNVLQWNATGVVISQPIIGDSVGSPWGVHGEATQAMADANQTAAASVYALATIKTTGAITANRTLTLPTPASDAAGYWKFIRNACTGAFSIVVSCGVATVTVANGKSAIVGCDSGGAYRMTPDT